jgi:isopentenyl-diphosphate delta-isomerase type 1
MVTEYLDVVNKQDVVIGKETRTKVHELGLWHRGVHVFLFTVDRRLLIQKRSADRTSSPSLLDCSVSEHVQAGESYLDAAIRGMKEEMGLEGIEIKRITKFRMKYGINDNEISELYEGVVDPNQVKFDLEEIDSIFYMTIDELQKLGQEDETKLCYWFIQLLDLYWNGKGEMQVMD